MIRVRRVLSNQLYFDSVLIAVFFGARGPEQGNVSQWSCELEPKVLVVAVTELVTEVEIVVDTEEVVVVTEVVKET